MKTVGLAHLVALDTIKEYARSLAEAKSELADTEKLTSADRKTLYEMIYADVFLDLFDNRFSIMAITFSQFKAIVGPELEKEAKSRADAIGSCLSSSYWSTQCR